LLIAGGAALVAVGLLLATTGTPGLGKVSSAAAPPRSLTEAEAAGMLLTAADMPASLDGAPVTWRGVQPFAVGQELCGKALPAPVASVQTGFDTVGATASVREVVLQYSPGAADEALDSRLSDLAACALFDAPLTAGGTSRGWTVAVSQPARLGQRGWVLEGRTLDGRVQRTARFYFIRRGETAVWLLYAGPDVDQAGALARLAAQRLAELGR
jgi:hypothetical protein